MNEETLNPEAASGAAAAESVAVESEGRVPYPTDALSVEFWARCGEGELVISKCDHCGRHHFYSRRQCPYCHSEVVRQATASGRGKVHSYTAVHRAPAPAFAEKAPYLLALIELEEGPRLLSWLEGVSNEQVEIGMRVEVEFEDLGDGVTLHRFHPANTEG